VQIVFERRLTLFRLFGFRVSLDLSWLLIALLVTWSLAEGFFPRQYPDLSKAIHWAMGILGAVGLFASIIFHEFCHSLVARHYGLPMKGITLFIFGGIAEMSEEPRNPKTEFLMAVAGPVSSFLLALVFYALWITGHRLGWGELVYGIFGYLAFINMVLAVFNLLPAFPLDGGRILRSALWQWKKDLRRATRITTRIGAGFGIALAIFGLINLLSGNLIGGIWYFLIGLFVRGAANMSYRQLLLQQAFEGKVVANLMNPEPATISADLSLSSLIEQYVPRQQGKTFPITENGRLAGCVTLAQIKSIPKEEWDKRRVGDIARACPEDVLVHPDTEIQEAMSHMKRSGLRRILVVKEGKLVGTLAYSEIRNAFSAWMDLENET
jgi:Zn-dependent protease/CBS domain-containing protein